MIDCIPAWNEPASPPAHPKGGAAPRETRPSLVDRGKFATVGSKTRSERVVLFALQDIGRQLYFDTSIRYCLHSRIPGRDTEIWRDPNLRRAYYRGLMTCQLSWICPICGTRSTEYLRQYWRGLLSRAVMEVPYPNQFGYRHVPRFPVGMATLTVGHKLSDPADQVMGVLLGAYKMFWSGRDMDNFKRFWRIVGSLRGLDPVYSYETGFHFHLHVLIIFEQWITKKLSLMLRGQLARWWVECVARAGGYTSEEWGFDFEVGDNAAIDYVAKLGQLIGEAAAQWGQIGEVTKSPVKRGKGDASRSLWELLIDIDRGVPEARRAHAEMIGALRGKPVIHASRGLAEYVGGRTDPPLPSEEPIGDLDYVLLKLAPGEWAAVKAARARGHLLDLAAIGDVPALRRFLDELK